MSDPADQYTDAAIIKKIQASDNETLTYPPPAIDPNCKDGCQTFRPSDWAERCARQAAQP
jgi:hypothetical protein